MAHGAPDIGLDCAPEERGIPLGYIRGTNKAKLLVDADLGKLVEESVELARIKGVAKLPDQIRGTDQAGFSVRLRVVTIIRHRKPGQLDGARDAFGVDHRV